VTELGLFPLEIVLLPTERLPLHIFEPRYKELIGECLENEAPFGLVLADAEGIRDVGTEARVVRVLDEFPDGRLNILVEGGERVQLVELTEGRTFRTARVERIEDDDPVAPDPSDTAVAVGAFRALALMAEADPGDVDTESPVLSYELAGRVELPAAAKQQLLELRSERARLRLVAEFIDAAGRLLTAQKELAERASRNGSRLRG
jgi:Lon protease-like protein